MSHIKRTNQSIRSGYFTVPESKSKVREISQPVKIAQLLGISQNAEKNSTAKMSKLERLTPYLKSSRKKNATNIYTTVPCGERNVRRNLDFTETLVTVASKNLAHNITEKLSKEKEKSRLSRKSFLLPPNSIKDIHVKNSLKQKKPVLSKSNVKTNSGNTYLRIIKESKCRLSMMRNSSTHTKSIMCGKNNKTSVIQHTSSQTFNVNDQSGINILSSPNSDRTDSSTNTVKEMVINDLKHDGSFINISSNEENNYNVATNVPDLSSACMKNAKLDTELQCDVSQNICDVDEHSLAMLLDTEKIHEVHSTNAEQKTCLSRNICEDLDLSLQIVKNINESCATSQFNVGNNEYVILSKTRLTDLACQVKLLVSRLEEDMSNLKLTLTTFTNTVSAANMINTMTGVNEVKIKQPIEHLNDNAEAINYTCINSPVINGIQEDDILKEIPQHIIDSSKLSKTLLQENTVKARLSQFSSKNNKENKEKLDSAKQSKSKFQPRRRSMRLMAKSLNHLDTTNDSFVNLENELYSAKSETSIASPGNYTPARINADKAKIKDKKEGRPLKEYMALKSRMSCLLTPNIKRFNSESKVHPKSESAKTTLSNKILVELNNLYTDSPDVL